MSNFGAIVDKNTNKKGVLVLQQVTDAFVWKTPVAFTGSTGTSIDMGEISESEPGLQTDVTEFKNEAGVSVNSEFQYKLNTTATLMERDKIKVDFLGHWVKNRYFLQYKYMGIVDGKNQEYFTLGKVTPQFNLKLPGGASALKYDFKGIFPSSTITFTGTQLAAIETALTITIYCTGVSITATKGYDLKETTVT